LCLLVLDNAADLGVVRRFVPAAGQSRVVVTTTESLPGMRGTAVPVGVFGEGEGLAFQAGRTGLGDVAGARAVAEELGWLPLGLAQAGAAIAGQRLSYGVYLERLRQVPVDEYLAAGLGDAYPRGVAEAVPRCCGSGTAGRRQRPSGLLGWCGRRAERGDLAGDVRADRAGRLKRESVAVGSDGILAAAALGQQRAAGDVQLRPGREPGAGGERVEDRQAGRGSLGVGDGDGAVCLDDR
jgi:hypothetical protein